MIIINFLWALIELGIVVGLGLYLWQDYRRGWVGITSLAESLKERFQGWGLLGFSKNRLAVARREVKRGSTQLAIFRDRVAALTANIEMSHQQAVEQQQLAQGYKKVEEDAARIGDDARLASAAAAKISHEARATFFQQNAEELLQARVVLEEELTWVETEHDRVQMYVDQIEVKENITAVRHELYEVMSDVSLSGSSTGQGELKRLLLESKFEEVKSDNLLKMVKRQGEHRLDAFLMDEEIKKEIEEVRNRIALPSPYDHAGSNREAVEFQEEQVLEAEEIEKAPYKNGEDNLGTYYREVGTAISKED